LIFNLFYHPDFNLNMKKLTILPAFLLLVFSISAQTSAKKYVLLEHFTNSKCSICASRNPAFYSLIGQPQYAPDIHHISIHPSVPYNTCVFYLANTTDNNAWASLYGIQGTPRVALNGKLLNAGSQLLRQDTLTKYLNQTSPLYLKVTETGGNSSRNVTVEARALDQIPAGNYKLFVAVVEKTINMTTPNGEGVHRDVFRDMLTPVAGETFTAPAAGQSATFNFSYNITTPWNADEVYAVAFVKEVDTDQVLNSGTKFDAVLSNSTEIATKSIHFSPNPANQITYAAIGDDVALRTEVYAANGQLVYINDAAQENTIAIPTQTFAPGVYFVKITGAKSAYSARMLKQ